MNNFADGAPQHDEEASHRGIAKLFNAIKKYALRRGRCRGRDARGASNVQLRGIRDAHEPHGDLLGRSTGELRRELSQNPRHLT
jgi:hypothetical protein